MTTIVIMPGGFHPFHAGHMALYNSARKAFPNADLYVAATNSQETRPFPFAVKEKLAKVAGVEPGHFVQVKSPFQSREITQNYNPEQDVLIFVRSEKDRTEQPKPGGTKKDGSPAYFQPYTGKDLQPFGQHAYIAYLPTVEFGPGITSATEIRNAWPKLDDRRKTAMVMSLYPATQKNPKLAANVVAMLDQVMGGQVDEDISRRDLLKKVAAGALGAIGGNTMAKGGGGGGGRGGGGGGRASSGGHASSGGKGGSAGGRSSAPHAEFRPGVPFVPHGASAGHGGSGNLDANNADRQEYVKFLSSYADTIRQGRMTPEMRKWLMAHPDVIADLKRGPHGLTMGQLNADLVDLESRKNYHLMREEGVDEGSEEALQYATQAHAGQTRAGGDPYITHPMRVADHIKQYKQSHNLDALISAAYLHDTVEDTDTTHEALHDLFGGLVASLVKELTSDPEEIKKVGKAQYLAHKMAAMSSYALVIKLADRLDNVKDITTARTPQWRQKYKNETEHILNYIEKTRALSGTHQKLIGLIREKLSELDSPQKELDEGPYVQRIVHPKKINLFVRIGKGSRLIASDIPYEILDKYINKVIQKYPQFKQTDFSFKSSDKTIAEDKSLSVEQLAHISDKALDDTYHYGRSTPGANFGWMANLQSAKAAKRLIDAGETDIEKISDAIHKGWNITAAADYKGQLQLDTPTPEDKKLKRAKLAMQSYSQLPEEEKEKDRVVARALLQAIKGDKVDEGFGLPMPGTYEQEHDMDQKQSGHHTHDLTSESKLSESADYLDEK